MDQTLELALRYARAAWRRRWIGMLVAWMFCTLGWVGVHFVPNMYQSNARIFVDTDAVLTPLLRGLAVDVSPDEQLAVLQQTLLSRPNLQALISRTDLGLAAGGPAQRELLIQKLQKTIKVTPGDNKNLFGLSYSNKNPRLARDVVQTLLSIFTESATSNNRRDMDNAQQFLERQVASYQDQLHALEQRRAQFRSQYAGLLPGDGNGGLESIASAQDDVQKDQLLLAEAMDKENMVKREAARLFPKGASADHQLVITPGMQSAATQLAQAEAALQELEVTYTADYPGVIAQKKLVEALRKQAGVAPGAQGRTDGPMSAELYSQMTMKLLDMQVTVTALKNQLEVAKSNLEHLRKLQAERPGLLVQYQNMDRDYDVLQKNYNQLLGRLQSAKLSQAADTQAEKVHLRIVDPPEIPLVPTGPNRPLLITAVLALGVLAGAGAAVLLSLIDTSFSSPEDLRAFGLPVLGSLPMIGERPVRRKVLSAAQFAIGAILLIVTYGGLIVHLVGKTA